VLGSCERERILRFEVFLRFEFGVEFIEYFLEVALLLQLTNHILATKQLAFNIHLGRVLVK
jgi:hypothetical protein